MSNKINYPDNYKYTKDHEWAHIEGDTATVGITYHAQNSLGDIVFVELPQNGKELKQGDSFGVVESIKAVSDLYSPLSGVVIERNEEAIKNPNIINTSPHDSGWLIKLKIKNKDEVNNLLDSENYKKHVESL